MTPSECDYNLLPTKTSPVMASFSGRLPCSCVVVNLSGIRLKAIHFPNRSTSGASRLAQFQSFWLERVLEKPVLYGHWTAAIPELHTRSTDQLKVGNLAAQTVSSLHDRFKATHRGRGVGEPQRYPHHPWPSPKKRFLGFDVKSSVYLFQVELAPLFSWI